MGVEYYYCTGYPADVANEVRTSVRQLTAPTDFIKIGSTDEPEKRFEEIESAETRSDDSQGRLIVIYEALSKDQCSQVESTLVEWLRNHDYRFETEGYVDIGGSDSGPYFVYLLLDRKGREN